jgi:pimeloyl-ACP methyl ester carboxylesterase
VQEETELQVRVDGDASLPVLIYLPGLHGDWTLLPGFRESAKGKFRLVQFTYPRALSWTLEDYARGVDREIARLRLDSGWVLAESFGSQVGWEWLRVSRKERGNFTFRGMILAGGFVRYPLPLNLVITQTFFAIAPWPFWKAMFATYLWYSGFRHRNAGPAGNCAREFIERRTPFDIAVMRARLKLIRDADLRPIAKATRCGVYLLAGAIDPVVPPTMVARWLRRNCPGFRGARVIWPADHNILGTEPAQALAQIDAWIQAEA